MAVVILGASGHGKVVCDALLASGLPETELLGFVDDDPHKWDTRILGFPVLGSLERLNRQLEVELAMGIGDNAARRGVFDRAGALGYRFVNVIHPTAVIGRGCALGRGIVAFANAVVNSGSSIGDDVILNTSCSVDHDCTIGQHAHIAPGARLAGSVRVGVGALVGVGASIIPGREVGDWSVVGAGACITRSVPPGLTVVGVPAKGIR